MDPLAYVNINEANNRTLRRAMNRHGYHGDLSDDDLIAIYTIIGTSVMHAANDGNKFSFAALTNDICRMVVREMQNQVQLEFPTVNSADIMPSTTTADMHSPATSKHPASVGYSPSPGSDYREAGVPEKVIEEVEEVKQDEPEPLDESTADKVLAIFRDMEPEELIEFARLVDYGETSNYIAIQMEKWPLVCGYDGQDVETDMEPYDPGEIVFVNSNSIIMFPAAMAHHMLKWNRAMWEGIKKVANGTLGVIRVAFMMLLVSVVSIAEKIAPVFIIATIATSLFYLMFNTPALFVAVISFCFYLIVKYIK